MLRLPWYASARRNQNGASKDRIVEGNNQFSGFLAVCRS